MQDDAIVIGAGVIGLSCAIELQSRGLQVHVLERERPGAGASAGNAGAFAFSDILPLASPGILRKAPGWLLDPLGPLSLRPAYALQMLPWLWRFWRACAPDRVAASTRAQTALMDFSRDALEPFLERSATSAMLHRRGNLQVYEGEAEFRASLPGWSARADHGIGFDHLDAAGMAEIQPGLAPRFTHGTFTPVWYSISDPLNYVEALAARFLARGGRITREDVAAITPGPDGIEVTCASGARLRGRKSVLAAGAHSHRIARTLGEHVPLETERGYNTTLPPDAFDLRTQITFGGHGFVVSPLSGGIRVGGAVELAGLDLAPNMARADAMLQKAARFLPGLRTGGGRQWMGMRPSLPDSLPVIGPSRADPRIVHAFGHGHLGLTQSAGTAVLVAQLLTGQPAGIDLTPFSSTRFRMESQ